MTGRSFVSPATRSRVRGLAVPAALALGRLGLTPNALTVIGFVGMLAAAAAAAYQQWILAGILVIGFGIFDLFDGALARATGRASKFGAFLDSTLDRTGENVVLAGIAIGSVQATLVSGVALAGLAMAFASVVTYTRAKAELLGLHGEVGFAPREVRLLVLAIGLVGAGVGGVCGAFDCAFFHTGSGNGPLELALGFIAVFSAVTVIQRILHVKQQLEQQENQ